MITDTMLEELKEEAEKTWNFHRNHDMGLIHVSEAKKLFDKLLEIKSKRKKSWLDTKIDIKPLLEDCS